MAVVEAVEAVGHTPMAELPPLSDAVAPDALDAVFAGRETDGVVTFEYGGYVVRVRAGSLETVHDGGRGPEV